MSVALVVAGVLTAGSLAACGGDDTPPAATSTASAAAGDASASPTSPTSSTGPASATNPVSAEEPGAASRAATGATGATPSGPRTVVHAAGTAEIPAHVDRVVALDQAAALDALALGVEPAVAFAGFGPQPPLDAIIASHPAVDVEPYAVLAPSVEAVAAARPDLILASGHPTTIATYDAYRGIAPTVVIPFDTDWSDQLAVVAAALDRDARRAEVAARIDAAVGELRDAIAEGGLTGTTVSVVGARGGTAYAFPSSGLPGRLLHDVGAGRPVAQQLPASGPVPLLPFSVETLADHDADVLILIDSAATDTEDVIVASPLYPTLRAVTEGHAYTVDGDMWLGASPFSALWIVQDLTSILIDGAAPDRLGTPLDRWRDLVGS